MGGGGVFRVAKFCKFLPEYRWHPIVLTVKEHDTEHIDAKLLTEVRKATIYKTAAIDLPLIYKKIAAGNDHPARRNPAYRERSDSHFLLKIKKVINDFLLIPDSRVGWIPFAVFNGFKICKKEKVNLIFSTGGPWTNHIIGLLLKFATKLTWTADFRDNWTQDPFTEYPTNFRRKIEEKLEKWVLKKADKVITTTQSIRDDLLKQCGKHENPKFNIIRNGYDREDFINLKFTTPSKFTITHTGNFYARRTPKYFLKAVRSLIDDSLVSKDGIKVKFVGAPSRESLDLIKNMGLGNVVECTGSISHERSIQTMCDSDLLLLIIGTEQSECTGKVFEYLATNKHILSLSGVGELSKLLNEFSNITTVDPYNVEDIKSAVYHLYLQKESDGLSGNSRHSSIKKYERKKLTSQLSHIFDKCLEIETPQHSIDPKT
jgi:glycosyltransferase involved in cell wall biosynthesis